MRLLLIAILGAGAIASGPVAGAQIRQQGTVSLEGAMAIADAAMAEAQRRNAAVTIVVVDSSGDILLIRRMDDAPLASLALARGKADTALKLRVSTGKLEQAVSAGAIALLSIPGLVASGGGVPIQQNEETWGAVAVSGASSAMLDEKIAQAGLAALVR